MPSDSLNIVIAGVGGQGTVLASKLLATCALQRGAMVRNAETIGMAQRGGSVLGHVRISLQTDPQMSRRDELFDRPDQADQNQVPGLESAAAKLSSINSPLVPRGAADILIGFEPSETVKALPFLKPAGMVVSAIKTLAPPTASLQRLNYDGSEQIAYLQKLNADSSIGHLTLVDGQKATDLLGSVRVLNTVLLGATLKSLADFNLGFGQLLSLDSLKATMELLIKPQFLEMNIKALELGAKTCR